MTPTPVWILRPWWLLHRFHSCTHLFQCTVHCRVWFKGRAEGSVGIRDSDCMSLLPSHTITAPANGTHTLNTGLHFGDREKKFLPREVPSPSLTDVNLNLPALLLFWIILCRPPSRQDSLEQRTLFHLSEVSGASRSPGPPWISDTNGTLRVPEMTAGLCSC